MPLVHVKTKKLEFKFNIQGKYTVLVGDSGIGKTTFYNLISDLDNDSAGIQRISKMKIVAVPRNFENFTFEKFSNCILVIDENCTLFNIKGYEKILKNSNNYFILINRGLKALPIHVDSVFTLDCKNHFYTLKPIYSRFKNEDIQDVDTIIVEDSSSGFSFVKDVFSSINFNNSIKIETAKGESNIVSKIQELYLLGSRHFVIIYDAAAFAGSMASFIECTKKYNHCSFFVVDWESFEHYILSSSFFNKSLILEDTGCEYESLEQFSTVQLSKVLQGYKKEFLPSCLKRSRCKNCGQSGCYYRRMPYSTLIYGRLALVYDFLLKKYGRIKVDFSYRELYSHNQRLKNCKIPVYRILNISNNIVQLENLNNNQSFKKSVIDIVLNIQKGRIYITNFSELRDWVGWAGVLN